MKLILLGSLAVLLVWSSSASPIGDFLDEKDSDDVARALDETGIDLIWYECKRQCVDNEDYDMPCIAKCVIKGLIDSGKRTIESPQKLKDARHWGWPYYQNGNGQGSSGGSNNNNGNNNNGWNNNLNNNGGTIG